MRHSDNVIVYSLPEMMTIELLAVPLATSKFNIPMTISVDWALIAVHSTVISYLFILCFTTIALCEHFNK